VNKYDRFIGISRHESDPSVGSQTCFTGSGEVDPDYSARATRRELVPSSRAHRTIPGRGEGPRSARLFIHRSRKI